MSCSGRAKEYLKTPKKFLYSNFSNTRNTVIIAGALATIGLVTFSSFAENISAPAVFALRLSIVLFLLTVLAFTILLDLNLLSVSSSLKKERTKYIDDANKPINIIYEGLDGKLSMTDVDKKLNSLYIEMDEMFRVQPVVENNKRTFESYMAIIGNTIFIFAILALIFGLSYDTILSFFCS